MSNYPDVPFLLPLKLTARRKTYVSNLEAGRIMRRKLWTEPLYSIQGAHNLSDANLATLEAFFNGTAEGMANSFTVTDPISQAWFDLYCGTGDGAEDEFDVPGKSISSYTVYIDDAEQTETTHYTIGAATGIDGRALITFVAAPSAAERVSISFTGQRALNAIFASDDFGFDRGEGSRNRVSVSFLEVRS